MEDDISPLDYGPGQSVFEQFQPPTLPGAPLTQADVLRLQRLQQGFSRVQTHIDEGVLSPEDGRPVLEQIGRQMAPLVQRQAAGQAAAKKQAMDDLVEQQAIGASILQRNAEFDTETFDRRRYFDLDPMTGEMRTYFQPRKGEWAEAAPMGGPAEQGAEEPTSTVSDEDAAFLPEEQDTHGVQYKPQAPEQIKPTGTPHTITIHNGANVEEATYDASGRRVSQTFSQGRPQQQQSSQEGLIPGDVQQEISLRANAMVAGMRPGTHRDVAYARASQTLAANYLATQRQQKSHQFQVQQLESRQRAIAQAKQQKLEEETKSKLIHDAEHQEMTELKKEAKEWVKQHTDEKGNLKEGAKRPDWMGLDQNMETLAHERALRRLQRSHPKLFPSQSEDSGVKGGSHLEAEKKPESKPAKQVATAADIRAELARRAGLKPRPLMAPVTGEPGGGYSGP